MVYKSRKTMDLLQNRHYFPSNLVNYIKVWRYYSYKTNISFAFPQNEQLGRGVSVQVITNKKSWRDTNNAFVPWQYTYQQIKHKANDSCFPSVSVVHLNRQRSQKVCPHWTTFIFEQYHLHTLQTHNFCCSCCPVQAKHKKTWLKNSLACN